MPSLRLAEWGLWVAFYQDPSGLSVQQRAFRECMPSVRLAGVGALGRIVN